MRRLTPDSDRPLRLAAAVLFAAASLIACDEKPDRAKPESASAESESSSATEIRSDASAENDEQTAADTGGSEQAKTDEKPAYLTGRVTPGRVTEVFERWRRRVGEVDVDKKDARALADVAPGAEVTVYFATWCPDSRREVPRLWKALRSAGGDVPFSVDYIALDHDFNAGDVSIEGADVQYVPTFVVERDGEEIGRIVETAPTQLERDLHALLTGEKEGVLTTRDDL